MIWIKPLYLTTFFSLRIWFCIHCHLDRSDLLHGFVIKRFLTKTNSIILIWSLVTISNASTQSWCLYTRRTTSLLAFVTALPTQRPSMCALRDRFNSSRSQSIALATVMQQRWHRGTNWLIVTRVTDRLTDAHATGSSIADLMVSFSDFLRTVLVFFLVLVFW